MIKKTKKTKRTVKKVKAKISKRGVPGIITAISIIDYLYALLLFLGFVFLFIAGTVVATIPQILKLFMPDKLILGLASGGLFTVAIVLLALGILFLYLAEAIKKYKLWAKIIQIVAAVIWLFNFPIGTIIGIFLIWVLLINKETRNLFK